MTRPCRFCGSAHAGRNPCVEGWDRCAECLERILPGHARARELAPKTQITVGVGLEKRDGIYVVAGHGKDVEPDTIAIGSVVED